MRLTQLEHVKSGLKCVSYEFYKISRFILYLEIIFCI
jgi:hypothetical protein